MPVVTNIPKLKIATLTKAQYNDLPEKTKGGLYFIKDEQVATLPAQDGNAGKVLGTDGAVASWVEQSGGASVFTTNGSLKLNIGETVYISEFDFIHSPLGKPSVGSFVLDSKNNFGVITGTEIEHSPSLGDFTRFIVKTLSVGAKFGIVTQVLGEIPRYVGLPTQIRLSDVLLKEDTALYAGSLLADNYGTIAMVKTAPNEQDTDVSIVVLSIVPASVKDMTVAEGTGVITCTFNGKPKKKSVHAIIGGAEIVGSWADNVFTPTTPNDILNNANGFIVVIE